MWSSHNVVLPEALFDQHPEYFAEIGGKRYKSNICFSHPDVDRLVAADTAKYCEAAVPGHPQRLSQRQSRLLPLCPVPRRTYRLPGSRSTTA